MKRILWRYLVLAVMAITISNYCHAGVTITDQYDGPIQTAVGKWWKDYPDWKDWKSQLYQESRLDPQAISLVGAQGLAQFMPGTWADIESALYKGAPVSRTLANPAIDGGAYFMASLRRSWSAPRPVDDRQRLAQASYNAGAGNILKAQSECGNAVLWIDISPCLKDITGIANARQTTDYVTRIAQWRSQLK